YNLTATGSLSYTLGEAVQGIGSSVTATTSAGVNYSIGGAGTDTYTLFTLGSYSSSAAEADTVTQTLLAGDLASLSTGTGTGSDSYTLTGSGNDTTGTYA